MEKEEGIFSKTLRTCQCKDKGNTRLHKNFAVHPLHSSAGKNSAAISELLTLRQQPPMQKGDKNHCFRRRGAHYRQVHSPHPAIPVARRKGGASGMTGGTSTKGPHFPPFL